MLKNLINKHRRIVTIIVGVFLISMLFLCVKSKSSVPTNAETNKNCIKWVDFNVSYEALCKAYEWDVNTYSENANDPTIQHVNWIQVLAYVAAKNGGDFKTKSIKEIDKVAEKLKNGEKIEDLTKDLKYYNYYYESYSATLGGM